MKVDVTVRSKVSKTFRAAKVIGMMDVPDQTEQSLTFAGELPIEDMEWSVGAIVGGSGTGKSTVARALWPDEYVKPATWRSACILDDFPKGLAPQQIVEALTSVGLASPPAWLRPYKLSTGQQFRADLARALVSTEGLVVYDEFTSVVDRTVAKAASVAVAKYARRTDRRFVAVTCHRDVLAWLEADWVFDTDRFAFSKERLRRPRVRLQIREGTREAWSVFRGHHYLTDQLSKNTRIWLAYVTLDGIERLAGFVSIVPLVGSIKTPQGRRPRRGWWRGHRIVVLPDYQGLGIGSRMVELVAEELWRREGKRYSVVTSAPGIVYHAQRHPEMWRCIRRPSMLGPRSDQTQGGRTSAGRLTTSWAYIPQELREHARD